MSLTPEMIRLVCNLEYKIGWWCCNPKWNDDYGLYFRYPARVSKEDPDTGDIEESKFEFRIPESVGEEALRNAYYKFGTNNLEIGRAIIEILQWMEERYGIDFSAMEKSAHQKRDYTTYDDELIRYMNSRNIRYEDTTKDESGDYYHTYEKTPEFMAALKEYNSRNK